MDWVVQRYMFEENEKALSEVLGDRLIWLDWTMSGPIFSRKPDGAYVLYSAIMAGRRLRSNAKNSNWLYDNVYNCSYYLSKFGNLALNNPHVYVEAGTFSLLKPFLPETFFIKENNGYKSFTGKVFDKYTEQEVNSMFAEELLLIAQTRPIDAEWRFVIKEGKVLTFSLYGEILSDRGNEALDFANLVLNRIEEVYDPAPMWTLDVCLTDNEFKVVEVNSLLSSGWYNCDVKKIVESVDELMK